jgi:hypothetical protein
MTYKKTMATLQAMAPFLPAILLALTSIALWVLWFVDTDTIRAVPQPRLAFRTVEALKANQKLYLRASNLYTATNESGVQETRWRDEVRTDWFIRTAGAVEHSTHTASGLPHLVKNNRNKVFYHHAMVSNQALAPNSGTVPGIVGFPWDANSGYDANTSPRTEFLLFEGNNLLMFHQDMNQGYYDAEYVISSTQFTFQRQGSGGTSVAWMGPNAQSTVLERAIRVVIITTKAGTGIEAESTVEVRCLLENQEDQWEQSVSVSVYNKRPGAYGLDYRRASKDGGKNSDASTLGFTQLNGSPYKMFAMAVYNTVLNEDECKAIAIKLFNENVRAQAVPTLTYPTLPTTLHVGDVVSYVPTTKTAVTSITVTPNLPAGMEINATTGVISGAPTEAVTVKTYTIQGDLVNGTTEWWLTVLPVVSNTPAETPAETPVDPVAPTTPTTASPPIMSTPTTTPTTTKRKDTYLYSAIGSSVGAAVALGWAIFKSNTGTTVPSPGVGPLDTQARNIV